MVTKDKNQGNRDPFFGKIADEKQLYRINYTYLF